MRNFKAAFKLFFATYVLTFFQTAPYPLTKYYHIIERVYFIYRLFCIIYHNILILDVFIYSIMEVKERLPPYQYRYFVLYYVLYY